MSFSLANPTGWATGDLLTESQINQLDEEHARAIDGTDGGTYTLASPLILNGSLVTIANLATTADLAVGDDLTVADNATIGDNLDVGDNLSVGGTTELGGDTEITGDLTITGTLHNIVGDLELNGSFGCNGIQVAGNTLLAGDTSNMGIFSSSSGGRIIDSGIIANNADQTINILNFRHIVIPSSVTGSHTYTTTCTSPVDGDWFIVQNHDTGDHNIDGLLSTIIFAGTGKKIMMISGSWVVVSAWTS